MYNVIFFTDSPIIEKHVNEAVFIHFYFQGNVPFMELIVGIMLNYHGSYPIIKMHYKRHTIRRQEDCS